VKPPLDWLALLDSLYADHVCEAIREGGWPSHALDNRRLVDAYLAEYDDGRNPVRDDVDAARRLRHVLEDVAARLERDERADAERLRVVWADFIARAAGPHVYQAAADRARGTANSARVRRRRQRDNAEAAASILLDLESRQPFKRHTLADIARAGGPGLPKLRKLTLLAIRERAAAMRETVVKKSPRRSAS
jgi:hypothetical protein